MVAGMSKKKKAQNRKEMRIGECISPSFLLLDKKKKKNGVVGNTGKELGYLSRFQTSSCKPGERMQLYNIAG